METTNVNPNPVQAPANLPHMIVAAQPIAPIKASQNQDDSSPHSTIAGVSIRGWIAIIVVLTICAMSFCKIDIKEPLYTLGGLIVGFYFGQNPKKQP